MNYRDLSPTIRENLQRYQATADRQASEWVQAEIRRALGVTTLTKAQARARWPAP